MATEYTPNYNLDLYVSTDKPNLRDQYNAAMGKIDTELKSQHDDNVATNNNIGTLQTQMKNAENDIDTLQTQMKNAENDIDTLQTQQGATSSALDELTGTVDGFEAQIAAKAPTNHASNAATYGAASLTQYGHVKLSDTASQDGSEASVAATPVAVSNAVAGAVDDLNDAIESLQKGKAPTNHAAAGNTYGLGSSSMFGHVKLSDTVSASSMTDGVALTPKAMNDFLATCVPKLQQWGTHSVGNVSGSFCVNEAIQLCVLRVSAWEYTPTTTNAMFDLGFQVPEKYRPTATFSTLMDVNYNNGTLGSVTGVRMTGEGGGTGPDDGKVQMVQYTNGAASEVSTEVTLVWFYGAQPATL